VEVDGQERFFASLRMTGGCHPEGGSPKDLRGAGWRLMGGIRDSSVPSGPQNDSLHSNRHPERQRRISGGAGTG